MKMKKKMLAGVLTAMMLVFTLGTTAFAADSPNSDAALEAKTEELNKNTTVNENAYNANNEVIKVTTSKVTKEEYKNANSVAKGQDPASEVLAMANISVPSTTNVTKGIKVTISASNIKAGDNVYVLHQLKSGAWQTIKPDSVADGKVTVTLYSFSPIAVVKYSTGTTPAVTTDPTKDENGETTGSNSNSNNNYNDNSNSSSQSNSQTNNNNNNQSNSQTNNQYNPVSVNQTVTINYPQSYEDGDGSYADDYSDGYQDGYTDGKNSVKKQSSGAANSSTNSASNSASNGSSATSSAPSAGSSTSNGTVVRASSTGSSAKTVTASGAVSYKTSPKTGAAVPALPIVAVFAAAGMVVCGKKARNN